MCFAISYVAMLLEKTKITKPITAFLSLCGECSFELYLVHIALFSVISDLIAKYPIADNSALIWLVSILGIPLCCFGLRRLTALFTRLYSTLQRT